MGYKIVKLQNQHPPIPATVSIDSTHPDWEEAYKKWIQNKPPTDSPEWTIKGAMITALTEEIQWKV